MTAPHRATRTPMTSKNVVCVDGMERPRSVTTYPSGDRVVLLVPATESAVLTPEAARELARHLEDHARVIESRQPGCRVLPFARS